MGSGWQTTIDVGNAPFGLFDGRCDTKKRSNLPQIVIVGISSYYSILRGGGVKEQLPPCD